jgi:WD40 repeat protein
MQGKQITVFQGHTAAIDSATFSSDGQRILTASQDGTARLWGVQGKQIMIFGSNKDHMPGLYSAVLSPDGQYVLTASLDKAARLWDMQGFFLRPHISTCVCYNRCG